MAVLTTNVAKLLDARVTEYIWDYLKAYQREYVEWCDVRKATSSEERVVMMASLPMPDEVGEYETFPETARIEGPEKVYTWTKYGYRLIASRELIEDERFPVFAQTAQAVARAMEHRIETQGVYDLNNAFTSYSVNDGTEYLCQTDHATFTGAGGGTQDNAPDTDQTLGADSLWDAINNFATLKDREGNPAVKIPAKIVTHAVNERKCVELLQSPDVPYKSTNEINAIRKKGLSYALSHYLTSQTAWFVITRDKPIRFYFRRLPEIKVDETVKNESRAWQISVRIGHGPYDWMDIYGTDGVA